MSAAKREVRVKVSGMTARVVYSDDLAGLLGKGRATTVRASHVEPVEDYIARGWTLRDGKEAIGWVADMGPVCGPVLGPFALRQAALDAELAYLRTHLGL